MNLQARSATLSAPLSLVFVGYCKTPQNPNRQAPPTTNDAASDDAFTITSTSPTFVAAPTRAV